MSYSPIDRFGVIGNMDTVALVGMDGSIDFMCFPYFDSPSIFARLLDHERGGFFRVSPILESARHRQIYLPDTNVLFTRTLSNDGVAEISDFMPLEPGQHRVVRRAKCVRGEIPFRTICDPRFNYGRDPHKVELVGDGALFQSLGEKKIALRLRTAAPLRVEGSAAVSEFTLRAGEAVTFVLEEANPGEDSPSAHPDYVPTAFKET